MFHFSIALEYLENVLNVLLVDNRACGDSEGKWTTFDILERYDLLKCIKVVNRIYPSGDIILHGISLGGATVCMTSSLDLPPNVKVIVSDCAYKSIKGQFKHVLKLYAHLPQFPLIDLVEHQFYKIYGCKLDDFSPLQAVKNTKVPIIFFHGVEDRYVPSISSKNLFENCSSKKELVFVPLCGHCASHIHDKKYMTKILNFASRFMDLPLKETITMIQFFFKLSYGKIYYNWR